MSCSTTPDPHGWLLLLPIGGGILAGAGILFIVFTWYLAWWERKHKG